MSNFDNKIIESKTVIPFIYCTILISKEIEITNSKKHLIAT